MCGDNGTSPVDQMRHDWYGQGGGFWRESKFAISHPVQWTKWIVDLSAHEPTCRWRRFCKAFS